MELTEKFLNSKRDKLERLREYLQCPVCNNDRLLNLDEMLQCHVCEARFGTNQTSYNFLPQSFVEYGKVKPTINVSANNYDTVALNLIERFKSGLILDNGCGLRNVYYDNVLNFEIVEYPTTDVLGIGEKLPFKTDAFDAVFSLAVLEHVRNPFECAQEIVRVLKPGGILYVAVPFLQPFHGYPDHYYNMTSSGLKNLFSEKLQIIECNVPLAGLPIWSLSWFLNSYLLGLPEPVAEKFKNMKVFELLNHPTEYLDKDFVMQLSPKTNEELASVNSLIAIKMEKQSQHTQLELEQLESQLQHTHAALQQAQTRISAMHTSKFWKLRTLWFKVKKRLNFWHKPKPELSKSERYPINDELIPPEELIFVGSGDFKSIGEEFLRHFTELGNLKPNETVLDVGCGIGRMAVPLTSYLNQDGGYEGFDIVDVGIDWCKGAITSKYPNFSFQLADIYNKNYNRSGKYKAAKYRFPYENETFDFVFLTSVFTHMLPKDMENYLAEIARVLKKGGRCLITFFLLNEESLHLSSIGKSTLDFKYSLGSARIADKKIPEAAVAYYESSVLTLFEKYGLEIKQPTHYGIWCGRISHLSYQDIIIAFK